MKNHTILLGLLLLPLTTFAQIAIGTISPEPSSVLDLTSTTRGFLPPRMNEVQMNAIVDPAEGLILYCLDCDPIAIYLYNGTAFVPLVAGITALEPQPATIGDFREGGADSLVNFTTLARNLTELPGSTLRIQWRKHETT